ncbi:MAG TPA: hypothetical protein VGE73_10195 [Pseudolabrys sp.]
MQTRRRRITDESSVGRESFTCVSRLLQLGQRIVSPYVAVIARSYSDEAIQLFAALWIASLRSQ